ncbi:MAG: cation diffusion facilitator family transporter [bacterium]|nr:cation diffusion facilitator family transporter [bacterium]
MLTGAHSVGYRLRAARISIAAAAIMVVGKLAAGFLTNSLAIFSDAGHSSVDMLAAIISFIAIRNAGKPPDPDHHYGHAKFESLGALIELVFLVGLGIAIVDNALARLAGGTQEIQLNVIGILLIAASFSVDVWRTVSLNVAARRSGSEALAASATHFLADLLTTVVVIVGIVATALGFPRGDSFAALGIAAVLAYLSIRLGRRIFSSLSDRAPAGLASEVETIVSSVEHVIEVHDIRIRQAGSQMFAEMHVYLDARLSLEAAHDVLDNIERVLQARFPTLHIVTHPEPWGADVSEAPPT